MLLTKKLLKYLSKLCFFICDVYKVPDYYTQCEHYLVSTGYVIPIIIKQIKTIFTQIRWSIVTRIERKTQNNVFRNPAIHVNSVILKQSCETYHETRKTKRQYNKVCRGHYSVLVSFYRKIHTYQLHYRSNVTFNFSSYHIYEGEYTLTMFITD